MIKEKIQIIKKMLIEHPLIPKLKDKAIFAGWIGGLLLLAGFSWFLSQPSRNLFLQRAVNRSLEHSGESRRLEGPLPSAEGAKMGSYFSLAGPSRLGNPGRVFVFTFVAEGLFFPCAAIIGADGRVEELIALNNQGKIVIERASQGVLNLYIRRIEGNRL